MLLGEPVWYAVARVILWLVILGVWSGDWFFHRKISILKYPLFILVGCVLIFHVCLQFVGLYVDLGVNDDDTIIQWAMVDFLLIFQVFNEMMTMSLILLIACGWGIMSTQAKNILTLTISIGGPTLIFILQSFIIYSLQHGVYRSAVSVIMPLWLTGTLMIWYYAFIQIDINYKLLSIQPQAQPSRPDDTREELDHEDVPFQKRRLYRRFAIMFAVYFILLLALHILTWFALIYLGNPRFFWMRTVPLDLAQVFLIGGFSYVFRLREDSPYFALAISEYDDDDGNPMHAAIDLENFPPSNTNKTFILGPHDDLDSSHHNEYSIAKFSTTTGGFPRNDFDLDGTTNEVEFEQEEVEPLHEIMNQRYGGAASDYNSPSGDIADVIVPASK